MTYNYRLHPLLTIEYIEAYEWYESKQVGLGERFLLAFRKKIDTIAGQPESYSSKGNQMF